MCRNTAQNVIIFVSKLNRMKMKAREANLFRIVANMFEISNIHFKMSYEDLKDSHKKLINEVYYSLGGIIDTPPINFGKWDIVTKDFIIELDEEQHFNRYRKLTLNSPLYQNYPWFKVVEYKNYCDLKESDCLRKAKRGGYWTNASTEKQFGIAAENGDFSGNGSPRWKQRAYYDFCRDIFSVEYEIPVYRFSIYDDISFNGKKCEFGKTLLKGDKNTVEVYLRTKIDKFDK